MPDSTVTEPTPPDELADLQRRLDEAQQTVIALERRQKIDQHLRDADAVDLDVARLLTEVTVTQMDAPDVAAAVAELRRRKPFLFQRSTVGAPRAMAAHVDPPDDTTLAAEQATLTGDRRDLLAYLRRRRVR